jgi:hypothetical protein
VTAEGSANTGRYRAACESLSVADFEYASAHDTEQKLWAAHLKVNTAFRQEHKIVRQRGKGKARLGQC